MKGLNVRIAGKILAVECENSAYSMHCHCRRQSRIVNLNAGDIVRDKQLAPFLVDGQGILQQPQPEELAKSGAARPGRADCE